METLELVQMEPAMEPTKEDWNNSDLSASTSVFDISSRSVDNTPHNNTAASELNFEFTNCAFNKSNTGEETAVFQAVPSNETICLNNVDDGEYLERSIHHSPRETLKTTTHQRPSRKSTRRTKKSVTNSTETQLPLDMESLSLKLHESNKNDFSNIEVRNIAVNQIQSSLSSESEVNTSVKGSKSQGHSDHKIINSTLSIQSDYDTSSTDRSVALNGSSLISESQVNTSSGMSENQDSSQFEANTSSSQGLNSSSEYANVPKHVQFNLETINEEKEGNEPPKPKRLRKRPRTKSKGTQVNVKTRATKPAEKLKQQNAVKKVRNVKPKENKIINNNPTNKNGSPKNDELTDVSQEIPTENFVISKKNNADKNIDDVAGPSKAGPSFIKNDIVNKESNCNDLSVHEEEKEQQVTSYNINIVKESDESSQPINISLPPQSTSKVTNINVIVSGKNTLKQTKKGNLSPEKIDLTVDSPVIKKEKNVEEEYNSSRKDSSKNPPPNKRKVSSPRNNLKENKKTNKYSKKPKKRASRAGTCTSSSASSSSRDEYTSGSESASCSCSLDEGCSECSCSDCESSRESCCSCSECNQSVSDYSDSSCDYHNHRSRRRRR